MIYYITKLIIFHKIIAPLLIWRIKLICHLEEEEILGNKGHSQATPKNKKLKNKNRYLMMLSCINRVFTKVHNKISKLMHKQIIDL